MAIKNSSTDLAGNETILQSDGTVTILTADQKIALATGGGTSTTLGPPLRNREPVAGAEFQPLIDERLHIQAATALDLSAGRGTSVPAGSSGRVLVSASDATKFAEQNGAGLPITLMVATWAPDRTEAPLPNSKTAITAGVEHLARSGYNALRIHGIEYWLMDGTTGEYSFPSSRLDLFDYFLSELKRLGIYYIINPRAPELYQDGAGGGRFSMPGAAVNMKPRLFVQQNARTHWLTGFGLLYNRINTYTGRNILADEACLMVECMNECAAQFVSAAAWPAIWMTRDSAQGSAAATWNEWLATQYANIAALNSAWSTAHANFAAVPAPSATGSSVIAASQSSIDAIRYCDYLNRHLADFFAASLVSMGYTGLVSGLIDFASILALKSSAHAACNVVNLHGYSMLAHYPTDSQLSAANTPVWGSGTSPGYSSWLFTASAYADGKPAYIGEYGWPSWASWRNQYSLLAGYLALGGARAVTCFHQGDFFSADYSGSAKARLKALFSYSGHGDPVVTFSQVASLSALQYVQESAYTQTLTVSDRYAGINIDGTSPRTAGRVSRAVQNLFLPTMLLAAVVKTRLHYSADNTDDTLASVWNARSWFDVLEVLRGAGAIGVDNEGWISANTNHGSVSAVETSGSVVGDITVTASATQPVLTLGTHTLVDDDHIALTSLTGSGGTWPGTNNRGTRAYVKRVSSSKVQIMSGLNLTGLTGFISGTWCEFDNVSQSANKQIYQSRRYKCAHIDTPKFKQFMHSTASLPWTKVTGLSVNALTAAASVFVRSLDGLPIATSRNLLIAMVGNAENTGQTFTDGTKTNCNNFGTYPVKMTDCTGDITITVTDAPAWMLYRLQADGTRVSRESVAGVDDSAGNITLALRSGSIQPAVFWELVR